jgi:hypothetical protein
VIIIIIMSDLCFVVDKQWHDVLTKWSYEQHECINCGKRYVEIDNIGKWQCKQHPLPWKDGQWQCCKSKVTCGDASRPVGCIRADHSHSTPKYTEQFDIPVPINLVQAISPKEESLVGHKDTTDLWSIVLDGKNSVNANVAYVKVRRFDWKASIRKLDATKYI